MTKENLNLPKTYFSMRANLPKKEPEIIQCELETPNFSRRGKNPASIGL